MLRRHQSSRSPCFYSIWGWGPSRRSCRIVPSSLQRAYIGALAALRTSVALLGCSESYGTDQRLLLMPMPRSWGVDSMVSEWFREFPFSSLAFLAFPLSVASPPPRPLIAALR